MSLANLFVELVVTGFHTLLWVGVLILAFTGYQQIDLEKLITTNLAIPVLSITYILGIMIDKLADGVLISQDLRIRNKYKSKDLPPLLSVRFYILSKSNETYEQLEYVRSRMRIMRAAVLNFAFSTIAVLIFVRTQLRDVIPSNHIFLVYLSIVLIGVLLSSLSYRAWTALTNTYISGAITAYNVLKNGESDSSKNKKGKPS